MVNLAEMIDAPVTPTAERFLVSGLLPAELPPFIKSSGCAEPLLRANPASYIVTADTVGFPANFNASKRGFQRRNFLIPHPVFIRDAGLFFEKNWESIARHFEKSTVSCSKPIIRAGSKRAVNITPHSDLPLIRLERLAKHRYCLTSDVSRCYPSIYTHSIPWALNGKAAAKEDGKPNSALVYGNRLDYILRMSQDRQTMGIAVGPDTSRVTAEIIMTSVDVSFQDKNSGSVTCIRHVDDFWIGADSYDQCEKALNSLRISLNEYSLDINELKTRIAPLSEIFSDTWPYELVSELIEEITRPRIHDSSIVSVLGRIISAARQREDDAIIKYCLRQIDLNNGWSRCWNVFEPFLVFCAVQFPHALEYVSRVVVWRKLLDEDLDEDTWSEVILDVLERAVKAGKDGEALWALWMIRHLEIQIPVQLVERSLNLGGPLVNAVLARCVSVAALDGQFSLAAFWDRVSGDYLIGSDWPLTLELLQLGVNPPETLQTAGALGARLLRDAGFTLVDWDAFDFGEDAQADDLKRSSALAKVASDYDDDEPEAVITNLDNEIF